MKPPLMQGNSNDFQTPKEALTPLLPYLKNDWVIWECASGKENLVKALRELDYEVISTDILTGNDFLFYKPEYFDCIITNPPYSIKEDFLKRCYELGKPFALLLPLTTFETKTRQTLFKKYGVQVIFFDKRINFETPSGTGGGAWFSVAWFTWGLGLKDVLNYERLKPLSQKDLKC